ncbi:hypothetical protein IHE44_0006829, partial [Lamprotornis superbus]
MAGRKAALKAVDWAAFAERVPPNQRAMFNALKTRNDALTARLAALPEKPPTIDWAFYKANIAKAGMVDEFQKKFSALKVPEPVDTQTAKIDAQEKEAAKSTAEYIQASKARISQYEQQLQKLKSMIPFEQMTFEDLSDAFPETKLNKEKYPYWPHKPIGDLNHSKKEQRQEEVAVEKHLLQNWQERVQFLQLPELLRTLFKRRDLRCWYNRKKVSNTAMIMSRKVPRKNTTAEQQENTESWIIGIFLHSIA